MAEKEVVKKNQKVKIEYVNATGETTKDLTEAHGVSIAVNGHEPISVNFANLPESIQRGAMAFGFNTRLRNEVNTAADVETGFENLLATLDGFKDGSWRSGGTGGGGTPDIIEALIRATTEAGLYTEEKEAKWREIYGELDSRGKAKQTEAWLEKGPVRKAYNAIKEEKAKAALARAKEAAKAAPKDADGDLGDL